MLNINDIKSLNIKIEVDVDVEMIEALLHTSI